jgi:hypothetical protein
MQDMFSSQPARRRETSPKKGHFWRYFLWTIAVLFVLFAIFILYPAIFSGATVKVYPRHETVNVNDDFTAQKGGGNGNVRFEIMKLTDSASMSVPAVGTEKVDKKASGTIVIYNGYSSSPQRLVARTRFKSLDGKIFRIDKDITIPGSTATSGAATPGSVEAVVYADASGEEYNIGLTDFTIPGFEGSPRYEKVYARSKTPMTGGFLGEVKTAAQQDIDDAHVKLEAVLRDRVQKQAVAQTPADFMLYTDPSFIVFNDVSNNAVGTSSADTFEVKGSATIYGILFSTKEHGQAIAAKLVHDYNGDEVTVPNIDKLKFTLDKSAAVDIANLEQFSFHLEGQANVEWTFNEADLKQKLSGLKKSEYSQVFSKFPGIEKADVELSPAWAVSFPRDPKKIVVVKMQ